MIEKFKIVFWLIFWFGFALVLSVVALIILPFQLAYRYVKN